MAARQSSNGTRIFGAATGLVVLAVGLALWLSRGPGWGGQDRVEPSPDAVSEVPDSSLDAPRRAAVPSAQGVRAPAHQIADRGRLRVTREDLREGDILAIGLVMPDYARGTDPLPLKVVDPSGRVLEGRGLPIDGAGTGLRLEIDPEWLVPGRYMIQVETAEKAPLALRRYVLEVVEEDTPTN
jgi:hypothetical protein